MVVDDDEDERETENVQIVAEHIDLTKTADVEEKLNESPSRLFFIILIRMKK